MTDHVVSRDHRELSVDAYRVCAAAVVVAGHWLASSLAFHAGQFVREDPLVELPWTQWLTWIFQVVPVFFLVAGYASAASWSARGDVRLPDWLGYRVRSALGPTSGYVVVVLVAVGALVFADVDPSPLALSGWAVAMHLWFIPMYLLLVCLTPVLVGAHRRWGLTVPAALVFAVGAVDAVSLTGWIPGVHWLNNLFCWAGIYQMGIAWYFGALRGARTIGLTVAAAVTVAVAVGIGPYPVSLIGVAGQAIQNSGPPSMVLVAYGLAQSGILIAIAPSVTAWLRRSRLRKPLGIANKRVMLLYLWHMIAVVLFALAVYPMGWFPQPTIGSVDWWLSRLLWVSALSVLTAVVLFLVSRGRRVLAAPLGTISIRLPVVAAAPLVLAGAGLAGAALSWVAASGFAPAGRFPAGIAALFGSAIVLAALRPTAARDHDFGRGKTVVSAFLPKLVRSGADKSIDGDGLRPSVSTDPKPLRAPPWGR